MYILYLISEAVLCEFCQSLNAFEIFRIKCFFVDFASELEKFEESETRENICFWIGK